MMISALAILLRLSRAPSIILLLCSASVLVTCTAGNAHCEAVHRLPTPSSSPPGEVVFGVVHRHHLNTLHRQSLHTEGRSHSTIQGSLQRGLQREESLNRATRQERNENWSPGITPGDERNAGRKLMGDEAVVAAGGEFMVQLQIGTPPAPVLLILDTGSGLTWIQCKQCLQCSPQSEALFDPSSSSSYSSLSCQSASCLNSSSQFQCNTINNTCQYGVQYGQSTFTTGVVSQDSMHLLNGSLVIPDFLFGCGLFSTGDFAGSSGLLGLSRSNISFPSQLRMHHPALGRKFATCFPGLSHRNASATGFISFSSSSALSPGELNAQERNSDGHRGRRRRMVYSRFAATPFPTQFYYLQLEGISVDGALLPINSSVLELDRYGGGGTVIDSGTTLTLLNPRAYAVLRDAFRSAAAARRTLPGVAAGGFNSTGHVIDTCYQFGDRGLSNESSDWSSRGWRPENAAVPSIALHFAGDARLVLPAGNVLFPFDEGLYCLAFASTLSDQGINVIGNIQQQNLLIEYDLENSRIGFETVPSCGR